ncbi:uncharacterized protein PV09_01689 [Verruconis gallopava]|uniref:Protein YAE1 n=1 Tax=Verruconis gallopava TaxID=253628 RepID=A0A0D1XY67_9PEZI|nr:uncharacterized protein PV09_01689 [Verruconis gallopava]KIW07761.1 hypothetical protein PV09_01689 [Verruconis gallopava]
MFTNDTVSRFSNTDITPTDLGTIELETTRPDSLDDVFGADTDDESSTQQLSMRNVSRQQAQNDDVSDVPRLQGIHRTNGYRDGVAASKEKFLQDGFDEGYSLGAELGAAAGQIVGVLESLAVAIYPNDEGTKMRVAVSKMFELATNELSAKNLYGPEYFGEDGIWKYEVAGDEGLEKEESITFRLVADQHPIIKKWRSTLKGLMDKYQLEGEKTLA